MSWYTERLADLKEEYAALRARKLAILNGAQEYTVGPRSKTNADYWDVCRSLDMLSKEISTMERRGIRVRKVVFR
jgi:hypothetical protein